MLHVPKRKSSKNRKQSSPNHRVIPSDFDLLVRDFLEDLDSPRSLGVWLLYKYGDHDQLVQLSIDPLGYDCADKFRRDYAATKFLSKARGLKTSINLKEAALVSARTAEDLCEKTNKRILAYRNGSVRNPVDAEWFRAKQIIAKILGPLPPNFGSVGWSPGRTSVCSGTEVSSIHKYTGQPEATWSARRHVYREVASSPTWSAAVLDADGPCTVLGSAIPLSRGNVMITVPKSAKTDRVICYEPHGNIWCQLGVGAYLKHRLLKHGIDLSDQSINQRKALQASLDRLSATIDLSMASDTLALELVYELLPIDWVMHLDDLRSKETLWPDNTWRVNQKFSSMGNGFTFELESLIFYALASAVTSNVSVYGDDIIVPTGAYEDVLNVLEHSGFKANTSKSFSKGNFRESCGFDGFCGVNCTPVYVREIPKFSSQWIILHNQIRAFYGRSTRPTLEQARILRRMRHAYPSHLGPEGYGDGHYHSNFEEATPVACAQRKETQGWDGWIFKTRSPAWRVSNLYGDRIFGRFSGKFAFAALAATTGPRRNFDVVQASTDRRLVVYRTQVQTAIEWRSIGFTRSL